MTETTPQLERPSLGEAYEALNYYDEQAVTKVFGIDLDDIYERLSDGEASNGDLLLIVRSLELVRYLHEDGTTPEQAEQKVKQLTKGGLGELLAAYMTHEDEPLPHAPITDEGKGEPAVS